MSTQAEWIELALQSDDPESALLMLAQGCTEFSCIYHGAYNQALRDWFDRR